VRPVFTNKEAIMAIDIKAVKSEIKTLNSEKAGLEKEVATSLKAHEKLEAKNTKAVNKLDTKIAKLEDKLAPKE
jgi:predicted  nucleic acid-binding Zn-ribbon protein